MCALDCTSLAPTTPWPWTSSSKATGMETSILTVTESLWWTVVIVSLSERLCGVLLDSYMNFTAVRVWHIDRLQPR